MAPFQPKKLALTAITLSALLLNSGCGNGIRRKFNVTPEIEPSPNANLNPVTPQPAVVPAPTQAELDPLNLRGLPEGFESITMESLSWAGRSTPIQVPLFIEARSAEKTAECRQIAEHDRLLHKSDLNAHGPCVVASVSLPYEFSPVQENGSVLGSIVRTQDHGAIRDLLRGVSYRVQVQLQTAERAEIANAARQLLASRYGVPVEKVALGFIEIGNILPRASFAATVQMRDTRRAALLATAPISGDPATERSLLAEVLPASTRLDTRVGSVAEGSGSSGGVRPLDITVEGPQIELEPSVPALLTGSAPQATSARILIAVPQRVASTATAQSFTCNLDVISRDVRSWTEVLRRTHFRRALSTQGECSWTVHDFHPNGTCTNNGINGDFSDWNRSEIESQWRMISQSEALLYEEIALERNTWCGEIADLNTKRLVISDAIRHVLEVKRFFPVEDLTALERDHASALALGQYQPMIIDGPMGHATDDGRISLAFKFVPRSGSATINVIPGRRFVTTISIPLKLEIDPAQARLHQFAATMERTSCLPGQARSRDGSTCVQACDRGQIFLLDHEAEGQPLLASAVAQTGRLSNKCFPTYTAFESYGRLQGYRPGSLPEQNPNRMRSLIESVNRHDSISATYLQAFGAMSRAIDEGMNSGPNAVTLGTTTRGDTMVSIPLYGERPSGI